MQEQKFDFMVCKQFIEDIVKAFKQTVHIPGPYNSPKTRLLIDSYTVRELAAIRAEMAELKRPVISDAPIVQKAIDQTTGLTKIWDGMQWVTVISPALDPQFFKTVKGLSKQGLIDFITTGKLPEPAGDGK